MKIPNTEALNIIEESIKEGNPVSLKVRGNSMRPLLLDGKDVVTLRPFLSVELKKDDVILFRYKGAFMLHRIVDIKIKESGSTTIITKGDAMDRYEEIEYSDVVALADLPQIGKLKLLIRKIIYQ